jgi:hypothetical protein
MLTLLNSVTVINNKLHNDLNNLNLDAALMKIYKKSKYEDPILYHLPASFSNYIKVLVRELEHAIAKELSLLTGYQISSSISIKNIIAANLEEA